MKILYVIFPVLLFCCVFISYEAGRSRGNLEYMEFISGCYASDVNFPDYNDVFEEFSANPVLYVDNDLLRLQVGSSIKHVEIGDPCVTVIYIEPVATNGGIELDGDPNICRFLITNCYFNMVDPNCH